MPGLGREVPLNSQDSPRFVANPGGAPYTPRPLTEESRAMTYAGRWSAVFGAGVCALLVVVWSPAVGLKDGGAVVTAAPEVLYAPEDKPADHLVALYEGARHTIYLATYGLTYPPVVKALIAAKSAAWRCVSLLTGGSSTIAINVPPWTSCGWRASRS